jgi:nicotinamidase/pyrazinamidase
MLPEPPAALSRRQTAAERDGYSAFDRTTTLVHQLRARGIKRLLVGGLATDYYVLNTVRDALQEGFDVLLLADAIRAIDVKPGDGVRAEVEMQAAGARPVTYMDITR